MKHQVTGRFLADFVMDVEGEQGEPLSRIRERAYERLPELPGQWDLDNAEPRAPEQWEVRRGGIRSGTATRLPGTICELGTCTHTATHTLSPVTVIPNGAKYDARETGDLVLCPFHEREYQRSGLLYWLTAYGDRIVDPN